MVASITPSPHLVLLGYLLTSAPKQAGHDRRHGRNFFTQHGDSPASGQGIRASEAMSAGKFEDAAVSLQKEVASYVILGAVTRDDRDMQRSRSVRSPRVWGDKAARVVNARCGLPWAATGLAPLHSPLVCWPGRTAGRGRCPRSLRSQWSEVKVPQPTSEVPGGAGSTAVSNGSITMAAPQLVQQNSPR